MELKTNNNNPVPAGIASGETAFDTYHGITVADEFRWMENGGPAVDEWLAGQKERFSDYFAAARQSEAFDLIQDSVRELMTGKSVSGPVIRVKGKYFYMMRWPGQQQFSIVMQDGEEGEPEIVVDPALRPEAPFVSVQLIGVSSGIKWLAYGIRLGGAGQMAVEILDLETRTLHPWSLPPGNLRSFVFEKDYTARYIHESASAARPHLRREIRQRLEGDLHYEKITYVAGESKNLRFISQYSPDMMTGIHRLIRMGSPNRETIMLLSRWDCGSPMILLADEYESRVKFQLFSKEVWFSTNDGSPNRRICKLDLEEPALETAKTVVPETSERIQWWSVTGDRIFVTYVRNLAHVTEIRDLDGALTGEVRYPAEGTAELVGADQESGSIFVQYQSYNISPRIYRVDTSGQCHEFRRGNSVSPGDDAGLDARSFHAVAPDGTAIPYTVLGRVEIFGRMPAPTILTAYGGNGISLTPQYSQFVHVWAKLGGLFAIANIRGGSEFGAAWYEAARGVRRTVAYEDFRAVAQHLVKTGITTPRNLGIAGGSNSGILVSHAMTFWPEAMRAVLCLAPLTDMLRFHREKPQYVAEYGSIADRDTFLFLLANSPYHRLKEKAVLPAMLMVSGARDETCPPYHAMKFVAAAQKINSSSHPIVLDFSSMRGHKPFLPLAEKIESVANRLAFMSCELGLIAISLPSKKGGKNHELHQTCS